MQTFAAETGTTIGVVKPTITHKAKFFKTGTANGWSTSTFPIPLTRAKYKVELEVKETPNGCIFCVVV